MKNNVHQACCLAVTVMHRTCMPISDNDVHCACWPYYSIIIIIVTVNCNVQKLLWPMLYSNISQYNLINLCNLQLI